MDTLEKRKQRGSTAALTQWVWGGGRKRRSHPRGGGGWRRWKLRPALSPAHNPTPLTPPLRGGGRGANPQAGRQPAPSQPAHPPSFPSKDSFQPAVKVCHRTISRRPFDRKPFRGHKSFPSSAFLTKICHDFPSPWCLQCKSRQKY